MKLTRIRVEQFKRFRKPFEIAGLEDKINLFVGPNEAGKSTIVAAIRAAFFERHRSSSVDDLRPWEDSSASPTVEIEFVINNKICRLTKSFLGKKRCQFQIGSTVLDGAEAEDHLSEILGFQHPGRGASGPEHWGIPGLLWIQQGSAQEIDDAVTYATSHLQTALNQSLCEVASSTGDEVLRTVEEQRNELLSPSKNSPRGGYLQAIDRESKLEGKIQALDSQIEVYRQKVDELASLRHEHAADQLEKPWENFRAKEKEARESLDKIKRLVESLENDQNRLKEFDKQIDIFRTHLKTFSDQEEIVNVRQKEVERAEQTLFEANNLVEQFRAKLAEASKNHASASEALQLARQEEIRTKLRSELEESRQKADDAKVTLEKAEKKQAELRDLQKQMIASEIQIADLSQLREQHSQLTELRIRQETSATRLRFNLASGHSIQIGEESKFGVGEVLLLKPTSVQIAELGQLEILPGGSDLAQLGHQEKEINNAHTGLLQRLGLTSLEAAEVRYQIYLQQLNDVKAASELLQTIAPKGVDELKSEETLQATRAEEIKLKLTRIPPADSSQFLSVSQAERIEEAAREDRDGIYKNLSDAEISASTAQAEFNAAKRELTSAQAVLDAPDRATRRAKFSQYLVDAQARHGVLTKEIEDKKNKIKQANPDFLQQDVERYKRSADEYENRFEERRKKLIQYEAELNIVGARGLEEQRGELSRDLMQAKQRTDELRKRSMALDLLLNLLQEKRKVLTGRLQAPLQKHLNRYLQLLFPGAHLEIDEHLKPKLLTRTKGSGLESVDFAALSFGSREQMGIISRLAYADLLQEVGRPTLLILDDALVHSDVERVTQMKRVLFDAASRHQILLFTCHPENWRDIGASPRSLASVL